MELKEIQKKREVYFKGEWILIKPKLSVAQSQISKPAVLEEKPSKEQSPKNKEKPAENIFSKSASISENLF